MLHTHGSIIGREYPQYLIPIDGVDNIKVQELLDGKLEEYGKVSITSKVKVTVMLFQDKTSGVLTMGVVVGQPHSNSESKNFIMVMESAASAASVNAGGRFSNFTVDGESCELAHVWLTICKFLSSKCNHLGSNNQNHNGKS